MGRNTDKRSSTQDQNDILKTNKEHSSKESTEHTAAGISQTEKERDAGKEGGARRGERNRNGSDHDKK